MITVARFRDPWQAHMLRGRLEAEGIPAFLQHEHLIGMNWPWSTALGGVQVQVPELVAAEAARIEQRCRSGEYAEELREEVGALDDIHCPRCGSRDFHKRRTLPQALLSIAMTLNGALSPPWVWLCTCKTCGTRFKTGALQAERARNAASGIALVLIAIFLMAMFLLYLKQHPVLADATRKTLLLVSGVAVVIAAAQFLKRKMDREEA